METKNVTIRIPQDVLDWLESGSKSKNEVIVENLKALRKVRRVSANELRNVFAPNEWKFLVDSLDGVVIPDVFRCSVSALVAHVEDAAALDNLGTKWGVDMSELVEKINLLHGANVDALYTRVEEFWASPGTDLDGWANY